MFNNIYKNKVVLIAGNTGFKGSWLSIWLLKLGAKVYGISKDIPSNPSMYKALKLSDKVHHFEKDIRDYGSVMSTIKDIKPDFIFHLAAQSLVSVSYSSPLDTISTNVMGTTNILESLKELNHKCTAIIITSDKCYDNVEWVWGYKETDYLGGKDIYSGSKGAAEIIFKSYFHSFFNKVQSNVKVATTRAGNVIGGGDWAKDRIVPDCMRSWSNNDIVEIRNPHATRPWQHVLEPLSGYLSLGEKLFNENKLNGESFNFGPESKYNYSVEEILKDLSLHWNYKNASDSYKIISQESFYEAGLLKLNCDKALLLLDWLPILEYSQLIEFTGLWYFNYYNTDEKMFEFTFSQINKYEKIAKNKNVSWAR